MSLPCRWSLAAGHRKLRGEEWISGVRAGMCLEKQESKLSLGGGPAVKVHILHIFHILVEGRTSHANLLYGLSFRAPSAME